MYVTTALYCLGICCLVESRWKEVGREGEGGRKSHVDVWVVCLSSLMSLDQILWFISNTRK